MIGIERDNRWYGRGRGVSRMQFEKEQHNWTHTKHMYDKYVNKPRRQQRPEK